MKVIIGGFAWVQKSDLTPEQIKYIKNSLTIYPRQLGYFPGQEERGPLQLFVETQNSLGMAREFYMARRKPHHEVEFRTTEGDSSVFARTPLIFKGACRSEQQAALDAFSSHYRRGGTGGILRAATGWGKTFWACALISEMKVPTLVVVHKEFLMNQFKEEIEKYLPGARVGIVQQDECDFKDKHVVLAMVHSLAKRKYPADLYKNFGMLLGDEIHRHGCTEWSTVPPKFYAKWRCGITATPRRKDGAEDVFFYQVGQIVFNAKEKRLTPKIRRVWTTFHLVKTDKFNPNLLSRTLLLRFLCASEDRNKQIVGQLIEALNAGRKVILLSERLKHLQRLSALFQSQWKTRNGPTKPVPAFGYYIGGLEQEELDQSAKTRVIFATSQMASEGLNIPDLDTLILATPMSDVEQATGRILRPYEGKKEPIVVDIRDDLVPLCKRLGEARDLIYQKLAA